MKVSQILCYLLCCLCCHSLYPQAQSLSSLPSAVYLDAGKTSIQTSLNSDSHNLLFAVVKAVDMEEVLDMSGPFTVFAPTDTAFSKFTQEELTDLFKEENKKKLKSLLTYHMVAGNLTASKILRAMCRGEGSASFTTVQGNKIIATMHGTDIVLTDGLGNQARITNADGDHSNGVVHQIDSVILPSGL